MQMLTCKFTQITHHVNQLFDLTAYNVAKYFYPKVAATFGRIGSGSLLIGIGCFDLLQIIIMILLSLLLLVDLTHSLKHTKNHTPREHYTVNCILLYLC